ncbi:Uncharacterised protein [Mycobacteroides abscessus subsp. abscessus]|nr:Uncharacterised protein [Mycobacteroides abscessus subsp. abscessus]
MRYWPGAYANLSAASSGISKTSDRESAVSSMTSAIRTSRTCFPSGTSVTSFPPSVVVSDWLN